MCEWGKLHGFIPLQCTICDIYYGIILHEYGNLTLGDCEYGTNIICAITQCQIAINNVI